MYRSMLGAVAILAVAVVVSMLLFIPPQTSFATLRVVSGQATIDRPAWVIFSHRHSTVEDGGVAVIGTGDTIRMGADAQAQIQLQDGSTMELYDGAIVQTVELTTTPDSFQVRFELLAGRTINRVKRLIGAGDKYEIKTPSSTVSVRGTVFAAQIRDPQTTYIACEEGTVQVTMGKQVALVQAGQELTAQSGMPLQVVPLSAPLPPPLDIRPPVEPTPTLTKTQTPTPADTDAATTIPSGAGTPPPAATSQPGNTNSSTGVQPQTDGTSIPGEQPSGQVPGNPPEENAGGGKPPSGGGEPPGQGGEPPGQQK